MNEFWLLSFCFLFQGFLTRYKLWYLPGQTHHYLCCIAFCFIIWVFLALHKSGLQATLCYSNLPESLLPHKHMSHSGLYKVLKTIPLPRSLLNQVLLSVNSVNTIQYVLGKQMSNATFLIPNCLSKICPSCLSISDLMSTSTSDNYPVGSPRTTHFS